MKYLQKKTGAYFTEIWLVFIILFLKVFKKLPLKFVNIFNVAEDYLQLWLSKHIWMFTALAYVTLKMISKACDIFRLMQILTSTLCKYCINPY